MAHSTLPSNRTTLTPPAGATSRRTHNGHRGGDSFAPPRDRLGTSTDVALAERRRSRAFSDDSARWRVSLAWLSPLDRGTLEPSASSCVQGGAQAAACDALDQRSRAGLVAATGRVHQVARRRMDFQHRQRLLRRLPVPPLNLAIRWGTRLSASGESVRADVQGLARLETRRWKLARVGDGRHVWSVLKARSGEPKAALACPVSSRAATADDTASRSDNSTVNA